ncbi:unnamed protein product [Urochloa decumbens]|uniref:Uncharacterized protein n=1 Tax=Urochloa decumbens TaxID=240449 RepID=A0ABC9C2W5_9POAL
MALNFNLPDYIMWKKEAATWDKDNGNGKDGSITVRNEYPQHPVPRLPFTEGLNSSEAEEFMLQRYASIARSIANDIIIPDPTPQVPQMEVMKHVSSILKEYGFLPTEVMDTLNLRPYDCKEPCSKDANIMETAILHAAEEKAARKEVGGGWDPTYARRSFFPYWRSVLRIRYPVRVFPAYARADPRSGLNLEQRPRVSRNSPMVNGSTPTPNHKLGSVGRILPLTSSHQSRRSFSTAAVGVLRLLKVLKHA